MIFMLAAESHGLATCPMEGYDENRVRSILNIPSHYAVPLIVAVGHYDKQGSRLMKSVRLPFDEVVYQNTFGRDWSDVHDDNKQDSKER